MRKLMGNRRGKVALAFAVALPLADLCGFCATAGYAQTTYRHFAESTLQAKLAASNVNTVVVLCQGGVRVRGGGCYHRPLS